MKNGHNLTELAEMPIGRLLWKYSLPAVAGMLLEIKQTAPHHAAFPRILHGEMENEPATRGIAGHTRFQSDTGAGILACLGEPEQFPTMQPAPRGHLGHINKADIHLSFFHTDKTPPCAR